MRTICGSNDYYGTHASTNAAPDSNHHKLTICEPQITRGVLVVMDL
jgi:hypothetical protein